jgi:hypothetical protein
LVGIRTADPAYDWRVRLLYAVAPAWSFTGAGSADQVGTSALINGIGALVTGVVLLVVAVTKVFEGARSSCC